MYFKKIDYKKRPVQIHCSMKTRKIYSILQLEIIICILFSCAQTDSRNDEDSSTRVMIDANNHNSIKFSDIFDSVTYIPLETTDDALVGTISHMRLFGNKVCLICDKQLLIFDADSGNASARISKYGNGPGEYISIYDALINESGNIELLDMNGKKIREYTPEGTFVSEQDLPFKSFAFAKSSDHYWFYNNNLPQETKDKVLYYNASTQKIEDSFFPIDPHLSQYFFVLEGNNFAVRKDGALFFSSPDTRIYFLQKEKDPQVVYTLDFCRQNMPDDFLKEDFADIMEFCQKADGRGYIHEINGFTANEHDLHLSFWRGEEIYWSFYIARDSICRTSSIVEDDINGLPAFKLEDTNLDAILTKDYFYFLMSAEQFLRIYANKELLPQGLTDESNPVLVKCKLKF